MSVAERSTGVLSGSRLALRRGILFRRLFLHLFPVVFDDAAGSGSYNGVMAGNVSHHAAYRRTFETPLGARQTRHGQRCGKGKSNEQFAHFSFR
jgi:hypothetical protein